MKGIEIFGKKIPAWILVASLVVAGAGAAAGTVLRGKITGKGPVTVSQALVLTGSPTIASGNTDASITTMSDDNTAFQAAAEMNNGDYYIIKIPVKNKATQKLTAELTLDTSGPVQIGSTQSSVVRISEDTWKHQISGGNSVIFQFKVALPDDAQPGFYQIDASIEAVNY